MGFSLSDLSVGFPIPVKGKGSGQLTDQSKTTQPITIISLYHHKIRLR